MKFKAGEYVSVVKKLRLINEDFPPSAAIVIGLSGSDKNCSTITWDGVNFHSIHDSWLKRSKATKKRIPAPQLPADTRSTTERLVDQIRARHHAGLKKYGVTVDRNDLEPLQWVQHFREELLDALAYLQRIEDKLNNK